jgi:SEC-C motif-containing protein
MTHCECGSKLSYQHCCEPRHTGAEPPPSPEALMRARYCAFAHANARYLFETWASEARPSLEELEADLKAQTARGERWVKLEVHHAHGGESDQEGKVLFTASLMSTAHLTTLSELSRFERREGVWCYVSGQPSFKTTKLGRNDPCPCGCGGKVKRCRG